MAKRSRNQVERAGGGSVAIYHCIDAHEGFEEAAQTLFRLVREAQVTSPGAPRVLYLDIDGHRNPTGGFDADLFELQQHFILGFLMQFLTEVNMPLAVGARRRDGSPQSEDIPEVLNIGSPGEQET